MPTNHACHNMSATASRISGQLDDQRLVSALEQYLELTAAGQAPDVESFATRYPEIAPQLRDCLAGLELVRQAAPDVAEVDASQLALRVPPFTEPLGDYRILREVGRGGMGIVYEAEQLSLGRRVALKILPFAAVLDPRHLQRFKNEAMAAAHLDHPNIVEVYGIGCERGIHFYAMRFIEGVTLAEVVSNRLEAEGGRRQEKQSPSVQCSVFSEEDDPQLKTENFKLKTDCSPDTSPVLQAALSTVNDLAPKERFRRIAELGIQAAEALDHAHQMGIVHRDIKPSNLMLDERGKLWITDFGLARNTGEASMTMTGDLVGTLRYMSPEQAESGAAILDHRSDIYSLGATLYELATLRAAFPSNDREETLRQIAFEEPTSPRKLNKSIPEELETIILKAMEKYPEDRYATARELADDLTCFAERRPIRARRTTRLHRVRCWARRNPVVAALSAALTILLAMLAIGSPLVAVRQARLALDSRHNEYVALMNVAYTSWFDGNVQRVREILSQYEAPSRGEDLRSFEYYHLLKLYRDATKNVLFDHGSPTTAMAISQDCRLGATVGADGKIRIWYTADGRELPVDIVHRGGVEAMAFSPDGRLLASGGEGDAYAIHIWNVESGNLLVTLRPHTSRIMALAVAADGATWASGANDGTIAIWDAAGTVRYSMPAHNGLVQGIRFSPDGLQLVTGSGNFGDQTLCVWNTATGERSARYSVPGPFAVPLDFAKNNVELLVGGLGVCVLNLKTGDAVHRFRLPLKTAVQAIAEADDGLVATGAYGHLVQLWDYASGDLLATLVGHEESIRTVAFSPDGRTLISGDSAGVVKSWDIDAHVHRNSNTERNWITPVVFSTRGDILVSGHGEPFTAKPQMGSIKWWDATTGSLIHSVSVDSWYAKRIAVSPDGVIAGCGGKPEVKQWRLIAGTELAPIQFDERDTCQVPAYSPDGQWLAVGGRRGSGIYEPPTNSLWLVMVNRQTGDRHTLTVPGRWELPLAAAFSADSRYVALGGGGWWTESFVRVWDVSTREVIAHMPHERMVYCVAFSPDGRTLATAANNGVRLWDIETGRRIASMRFPDAKSGVSFSPDGKLLAVCGSDHTIRLWSLERHAELAVIPVHAVSYSVAFSPDGQTLAWGGYDGTVNFLRAAPKSND